MALSSEDLKHLRDVRLSQIMPGSHRVSLRKPIQKKYHAKFIVRSKLGRDVGHDTPHHAEVQQILRKTCQIVPPGSPIEQALRETQQLQVRAEDFLDYVEAMLARFEEKGLALFFFTMKGFSSYPFLHCANLSYYGERLDEFYQALDEFARQNGNMYYETDTYRPITDQEELLKILRCFSPSDKETFTRVMDSILAKAPHYRAIDFVGHDRTPSHPPPPPPPPRPQ